MGDAGVPGVTGVLIIGGCDIEVPVPEPPLISEATLRLNPEGELALAGTVSSGAGGKVIAAVVMLAPVGTLRWLLEEVFFSGVTPKGWDS